MKDNDSSNEIKREYSADSNYSKTISNPNLNVKNKMQINMQSIDSVNLTSMRFRTREALLKEAKEKEEEEIVPDLAEVYGTKEKDSPIKITKSSIVTTASPSLFTKISPEDLLAIITAILVIVFSVIAYGLYNAFM